MSKLEEFVMELRELSKSLAKIDGELSEYGGVICTRDDADTVKAAAGMLEHVYAELGMREELNRMAAEAMGGKHE